MRKVSVILVVLLCVVGLQAATYNWTGGAGDGKWTTAGNWDTGNVPTKSNYYLQDDCEAVNVSGSVTVDGPYNLSLDTTTTTATKPVVTIDNGATWSIGNAMWIADDGGTQGELVVRNGSSLSVGNLLDVGNDGEGWFTLENNSTLTTGGFFRIGVGPNAVGHTTISDSTVNAGNSIIVGGGSGSNSAGYMTINGNSSVSTAGNLYMNDGGSGYYAELIMNSGTFDVSGNAYLGDDSTTGETHFTLNGGTMTVNGSICIPWQIAGKSYVTVNGGELIGQSTLYLGKGGSDDVGQGRLFVNGGYVRVEDLVFNMTDGKIIYTAGSFLVNAGNLSESDMNDLINAGRIDVSGADSWSIATINVDGTDYTALVPEPASVSLVVIGLLGFVYKRR